MLFPSIFNDDLFDGFFGFPFPEERRVQRNEARPARPERKFYGHQGQALMKTDVRETDKAYIVEMDLPGFSKEDVNVTLENGYLTIAAEKHSENEEKKEGKYIRKERYVGTCQRSFYVGEDVTEEDIKAAFKEGVLSLDIAKKVEQPKIEEKKTISIEG